jgi:hypothetical protein
MLSENNYNFPRKDLPSFDITIFEDNFKLRIHIDDLIVFF